MLKVSPSWGLDANQVKKLLVSDEWDLSFDVPALIRHLDGVQSGMWTHISNSVLKDLSVLTSLLGDAGYEVQLMQVHNTDELYVRRPLEEA
jgi:hypothetical protein